MSKPASKTAIGAFVVIAVLIVLAIAAIMGSGTLFADRKYCVSFFEGSVQGLSVGAPVKFRGVEVGAVTSITLTSSAVEEDGKIQRKLYIPVYYEIYDTQLTSQDLSEDDFQRILHGMVKNGLRAQMQMQSIITGQYFVQLDFYPDENPVFVYDSIRDKPKDMDNVIEVPAVTSGLAKLSKTIDKLPLEDILTKINDSLGGLQNLLNSDSTKEMVAKLGPIADSIYQAVDTLNENMGPALQSITKTAQGFERNSEQLGEVFDEIQTVLGHVDKSLNVLTNSLDATLSTIQDASVEITNFTAGESPITYHLTDTLKELRALTFNLNALVTILEAEPNALIWGK